MGYRLELVGQLTWRELLRRILFDRRFLYLLFGINLAGTIYGYYWYRYQLAATPWYFWPFTPECPNQSMLMSLVLILFLLGRRSQLLEGLTYLGLLKYGSWTVYIVTSFLLSGGEVGLEFLALVIGHTGMVVEAILYLPFYRIRAFTASIAVGWFFFNDYLDYWVGIYPYLPRPDQLPAARAFALGTSAVIAVWLLIVVIGNRRSCQKLKR